MKHTLKTVFAAAALLGAVAQAQADSIAFSYNFVDGESLTGAIYGDIDHGNVHSISSIQASINGNPLAGGAALYAGSYMSDSSLIARGAQFSSLFSGNNFFIVDQQDPNSPQITEEFGLFSTPDGSSTTLAYGNLVTGATTGDTFFNDGSGTSSSFGPNFSAMNQGLTPQWTLTNVPEPGVAALFGIGISGLMLGRRRKV